MKQIMVRYGLYFAWLVAIVATGGSLYFSEVMGFVPCVLCWYQRILMYPLVILLGIATYRQDKHIINYILPFSIIGILVSLYHVLIQQFPNLATESTCQAGVPCTVDYIHLFGFITIPMMAFVAFLLITISLLLSHEAKTK
jgi:disulfide bond formation protein DsbB